VVHKKKSGSPASNKEQPVAPASNKTWCPPYGGKAHNGGNPCSSLHGARAFIHCESRSVAHAQTYHHRPSHMVELSTPPRLLAWAITHTHQFP
jgi:hypothetical protein